MATYAAQRLLLAIPTFFIAMAVTFFALRLVPGDQLTQLIGEQVVSPEQRAALKEELGLDKPLVVQFGLFLGDMAQGDLGKGTFDNEPVRDKIASRLPITFELAALSVLMSVVIAIPIGIISAVRRNTPIDYGLRLLAILALSVPSFWLATIVLVGLAIWADWIPPVGYVSLTEDPIRNLQQFWLPSLLLGAVLAGSVMRMMRSMMLEVLREDYVRTAQSKGLRFRTVIRRHAVKNALIPVVTIIGLQMAALLGGTVVIESIFGLPGLGTLLINALNSRDFPVIQGIQVVIVLAVILVNIVVDLSYGYLDPRLRVA